jgi:hypothetical protein
MGMSYPGGNERRRPPHLRQAYPFHFSLLQAKVLDLSLSLLAVYLVLRSSHYETSNCVSMISISAEFYEVFHLSIIASTSTMARGQKSRPKHAKTEQAMDSDEDIQTLKAKGKASFNRDETFENSEDECLYPETLR